MIHRLGRDASPRPEHVARVSHRVQAMAGQLHHGWGKIVNPAEGFASARMLEQPTSHEPRPPSWARLLAVGLGCPCPIFERRSSWIHRPADAIGLSPVKMTVGAGD